MNKEIHSGKIQNNINIEFFLLPLFSAFISLLKKFCHYLHSNFIHYPILVLVLLILFDEEIWTFLFSSLSCSCNFSVFLAIFNANLFKAVAMPNKARGDWPLDFEYNFLNLL